MANTTAAAREQPQKHDHKLTSTARGGSEIERLAEKIVTRRKNRVSVPVKIRLLFLNVCKHIAAHEAQEETEATGAATTAAPSKQPQQHPTKFPVERLFKLQQEYKTMVEEKDFLFSDATNAALRQFGFWDQDVAMLQLLDAAVANCKEVDAVDFYFYDFCFYNTSTSPRVKLFANPALKALFWVFLYFFGSAVLFCVIMPENDACPAGGQPYHGWLTAVYFASVTMSTVGYGDVTLYGGDQWMTWVGTFYMLISVLVGYTVVANAASTILAAIRYGSGSISVCLHRLVEDYDPTKVPLRRQMRRVAWTRFLELMVAFFVLNMIGVCAARLFIRATDVKEQQWTWTTTFYWAVQTTTTIGYGDLEMPFNMRWFQIVFIFFGTAFVGAVLGAVASLQNDLNELRRLYAWKRREVSKRLIEDMRGEVAGDCRLDQYEFMVGSLLMLNKIEQKDVELIMDKFRDLAGDKQYIEYEDTVAEEVQRSIQRSTPVSAIGAANNHQHHFLSRRQAKRTLQLRSENEMADDLHCEIDKPVRASMFS